jgi:hypothetical protein
MRFGKKTSSSKKGTKWSRRDSERCLRLKSSNAQSSKKSLMNMLKFTKKSADRGLKNENRGDLKGRKPYKTTTMPQPSKLGSTTRFQNKTSLPRKTKLKKMSSKSCWRTKRSPTAGT